MGVDQAYEPTSKDNIFYFWKGLTSRIRQFFTDELLFDKCNQRQQEDEFGCLMTTLKSITSKWEEHDHLPMMKRKQGSYQFGLDKEELLTLEAVLTADFIAVTDLLKRTKPK